MGILVVGYNILGFVAFLTTLIFLKDVKIKEKLGYALSNWLTWPALVFLIIKGIIEEGKDEKES